MCKFSDGDQASAIRWFRKHFGISLSQDKKYLVETRLEPVAFKNGYNSVRDLLHELIESDQIDSNLVKSVCSAITTHETSFFRDYHPFDFLSKSYFPKWIESHKPNTPWSMWSAACSSGQEIYSIAMIIEERFQSFKERCLTMEGTDISHYTLEKAISGEFNQAEVSRGLQANYLIKYFNQLHNGNWRIKDEIRDMVHFDYHNLIGSWESRGSYDLIMLRNVLIYFDVDLKINVLNRLKHHLKPGGVLLLGGSETTANLDDEWKMYNDGNTVYYSMD